MDFFNKKIWKLILPIPLLGGIFLPITLTSCSVVYPKISWTGEQNININGADEKNEINVKGYFLNDFKDPVISYQDKSNNPLLDHPIEQEILEEYINIEITSDNKNKFILNFNHIGTSFDMEKCKKVDGCKIVFSLASKNNKYHYEFKKNVVFQSSKILDLSFQLDDSYKPEDYLKQIPSQDDFANTTIDALEPYRSGCTFADIKRRDNTTNTYFGYSTPTVPQTDPGYDEMLLRYVDITNMLKADICYFSQVMQLEVAAWANEHKYPIKLNSFNFNVDELKYDMETATILKLKSSGTASLVSGLVSVNIKINIFNPYQLFGAFKTDFADQQTYFSQLVPTLEDDDTLNANNGGMYEVGATIKILGEPVSAYDTYYSYVGNRIFGNLDIGSKLGFYLPSYWLSNCVEIAQLVWDDDTFDTDKFKIIGNGSELNNTNFLNIGMFKDISTGGYPDNLWGTSYFLEDESHISSTDNDNIFTVGVDGMLDTYSLKWYEIMSFFPDQNENEFYTKDDSGKYQITYLLNNCFIDSSTTRIIPNSAIQFNS